MNWLLAIAGLALITWSSAVLWCSWASRRWPVAPGELVTRSIRDGRNRSGPYYMPAVSYRYAIGHRRFVGSRRRFHALPDAFVTEQAAYEALAGLTPGARVDVHYHPYLPRLAVLRPGLAVDALVPLMFGLFFVLAAQ